MAKNVKKATGSSAPAAEKVIDAGVGSSASFLEVGTETAKIDVRISYRIIDLFSRGLYNSPSSPWRNPLDAGGRPR
jgi:hypothetical protein